MAKRTLSHRKPPRQKPRTPRVDPAVGMPLSMLRGLHRFFICLSSDEPEFDCRETERLQARLAGLIRSHEDEQLAEAARAPVESRMFRLESEIDELRAALNAAKADIAPAPRLESVGR
jgi:hypothetical protein